MGISQIFHFLFKLNQGMEAQAPREGAFSKHSVHSLRIMWMYRWVATWPKGNPEFNKDYLWIDQERYLACDYRVLLSLLVYATLLKLLSNPQLLENESGLLTLSLFLITTLTN